jgi:hypothetical protein
MPQLNIAGESRNMPRRFAARFCVLLSTAGLLSLFSATTAFAADGPTDPAAACAALATLSGFPISPTLITSAKFNPAGTNARGVTLPAHCQINGIINKRTGTDGNPYGDSFEIRLPEPSAWNGRFMFQGGGGGEGAVPPAVGVAGSLSPTLAHGWAVASQDGGHENSQIADRDAFFLEGQSLVDQTYRSIDVTTQTAKYLIKSYYGEGPRHSYWVGCSTGGRQGMVMSQHFPTYFDGIIAGDPVYDLEAINMSEAWAMQQFYAIAPKPIETTKDGLPLLYPALPKSDQQLFTKALLQACDGLDGAVDGVVDDQPACGKTFKPSSFVFTDTHQPLQCTGDKTAACLSKEQITAIENVNLGPRDSKGHVVKAPAGAVAADHNDNTMQGYPYDGGFMTPSGIPGRRLGTETTPPGDFATGFGQARYEWIQPIDPQKNDPLKFNFNTDLSRLTKDSIQVSYSNSLDIKKFVDRGGKIIWYHGASDPGPSVSGTIAYYKELTEQNGGEKGVSQFSRLYLVPNMGHCQGGPSTDQFDVLSPLVAWVEQGTAPGPVVASGTHFTTAPVTRSRPLCPYPQQARYSGAAGGDLSDASNYKCVQPTE